MDGPAQAVHIEAAGGVNAADTQRNEIDSGLHVSILSDMATIQGNDKAAKADREQLAAVRMAVDEVDEQIVTLIARRERLIRIAGTLKADGAEVRAPGRVERVIERPGRRGTEGHRRRTRGIDLPGHDLGFITLEMEVYKASS